MEVFQSRDKHQWPPDFRPPPFWKGEFEAAAERLGLDVTTFEKAVEEARSYIEYIDTSD